MVWSPLNLVPFPLLSPQTLDVCVYVMYVCMYVQMYVCVCVVVRFNRDDGLKRLRAALRLHYFSLAASIQVRQSHLDGKERPPSAPLMHSTPWISMLAGYFEEQLIFEKNGGGKEKGSAEYICWRANFSC